MEDASTVTVGTHAVKQQSRGVAKFGIVPDLGSGDRRFESCRPDPLILHREGFYGRIRRGS